MISMLYEELLQPAVIPLSQTGGQYRPRSGFDKTAPEWFGFFRFLDDSTHKVKSLLQLLLKGS